MILPHVTFLLTNVPIDLVKNSIEKRWNLIKSATNLPLQEFQKGIEFLIKILFFSLILRKLFKKKLSFRIHLYYRYVDDTFLIIPKNMIKETIENFNSYHTRLKLTGHGGTHRSVYDTASPGDRSVSTWPAWAAPSQGNPSVDAQCGWTRGIGVGKLLVSCIGHHLASPGATPSQGNLTLSVSCHRESTIGEPIDRRSVRLHQVCGGRGRRYPSMGKPIRRGISMPSM